MRIIKVAMLLAAVTLAACAPITVSSHLERTATFDDYITFDWGPRDGLPTGDPRLDNNAVFNDYLQGAIEKHLALKGFVRAAAGEPDVLVHYHANVSQRVEVSQNHYGNATTYDAYEPRVTELELGTIVIDMIDARTDRLVWRGWTQQSIAGVIDNQVLLEEQTLKGIAKLMQQLPPAGEAVTVR
jgi:hypothetical protein